MRFGQFTPDVCPSCGAAPYPAGKACGACGFVGPARSRTPRFAELFGLIAAGILGVMVLGLLLTVLA